MAGLVLTLGLLSGGAGDAQADSREFTGRVARIDGKSMLIDNRKGDKVAFVRTDATVVRGEKKRWGDIAPNDWVMVTWDMMDAPQKIAHKVVVMPRKGDE